MFFSLCALLKLFLIKTYNNFGIFIFTWKDCKILYHNFLYKYSKYIIMYKDKENILVKISRTCT